MVEGPKFLRIDADNELATRPFPFDMQLEDMVSRQPIWVAGSRMHGTGKQLDSAVHELRAVRPRTSR